MTAQPAPGGIRPAAGEHTALRYKEKFEAKFTPEPNTGCWLWFAAQSDPRGYGSFQMGGRNHILAHRAAWLIYRGEIPEGKFVCHKCDMPCCVNPDHLFIGTASDNTRDSMRKGRYFRPFGERNGAAKLTEKQVEQIRHLLAGGMQQDEIAQRFGVRNSRITQIKHGISWKHSSSHAEKLAAALRRLAKLALHNTASCALDKRDPEHCAKCSAEETLAAYEKGK